MKAINVDKLNGYSQSQALDFFALGISFNFFMYPKLKPQNSDYALINWCSVKFSMLNILKLGYCKYKVQKKFQNVSLREKCPNTELFLVLIFLYSDRIRRNMEDLSLFSQNTGNYGPEVTPYLDAFHAVYYQNCSLSVWLPLIGVVKLSCSKFWIY